MTLHPHIILSLNDASILTLPLIQQMCSKRLHNHIPLNTESLKRCLLNPVENNVAIVDIAHYQQAISTFDTIFSKSSAAETSESVYMCETVNLCRFLPRLFEEYESYTTHPGVGVHVTLWLSFCMQVLKFYMYCIETFYNPTKLSHLCSLSSKITLSCILCKLWPIFT